MSGCEDQWALGEKLIRRARIIERCEWIALAVLVAILAAVYPG